MRRVDRDEGLVGVDRGRERGVEHRSRSLRITARPTDASPLEIDPSQRDGVIARERHRLVEQPIGGVEVAA